MTPLEDRLRTELHDEATEVGVRPGFVETSVESVLARRRRVQRRSLAAVTAVAALVAGGIAFDHTGADGSHAPTVDRLLPPLPNPTPPGVEITQIQQPPKPSAWSSLPWRETALPPALPTDVASASPLSQDPVDRALALVAGPGTSVGVVGADGRLRRLDGVDLKPARDSAGGPLHPLGKGALTADGTRAAFPQVGGVVVVDFPKGSDEWFTVPGPNVSVQWHPDNVRLLVGAANGRSRMLDTDASETSTVPYSATHTAFTPDGTALEVKPIDEVRSRSRVTMVRQWPDPSGTGISIWYDNPTPPSATNYHAVVPGSTVDLDPRRPPGGNGWIILNFDAGEPITMLSATGSYWRDAWQRGQHGWLGGNAVVIQTEDGIVTWTSSTRSFERITEATGTISLALDAIG